MSTTRGLSAVPVVAPEQFLLATRDAGYRNLASALNELIDNSLQSSATRIDVLIQDSRETPSVASDAPTVLVGVLDNGCGMAPAALVRARQFGGSIRFDDRSGLGRFGRGCRTARSATRDVPSCIRGGQVRRTNRQELEMRRPAQTTRSLVRRYEPAFICAPSRA